MTAVTVRHRGGTARPRGVGVHAPCCEHGRDPTPGLRRYAAALLPSALLAPQ